MAAGTAAAAASPGLVLVFGGKGFVGTAVCREAARRFGAQSVLSLGRSAGAGVRVASTSGDELVEHRGGVDALRPETFDHLMPGARAVVISIGEPPWVLEKERAIRSNGLTNINILRAAARHKVPRIILINAVVPSWQVIAGYREGKQAAEEEARRYPESCGPECGVLIVKPSVISGTRYAGTMPIPLWLMLEPMRAVLVMSAKLCQGLERRFPRLLGGVLRPPVRVEEIAAAAADAIEDPTFNGVRAVSTETLVGYRAGRGSERTAS